MCFLGFARPNVGAIPPLAEMQIMWWLQYVQGEISLPLRSPSYKLLATTSKKVSSRLKQCAAACDLGPILTG